MSVSPVKDYASIITYPIFSPGLTWGLGNQGASWEPGPGGPLPDPRGRVKVLYPGPVYGRVGALSALKAFGPTVGVFIPWAPIAPSNNAWATAVIQQYVPGWYKPPPAPGSGF